MSQPVASLTRSPTQDAAGSGYYLILIAAARKSTTSTDIVIVIDFQLQSELNILLARAQVKGSSAARTVIFR
ncbi:hypothetical protein E4U21_006455 [Claviceps maximensis]|nr:hypothetical protein E4U21_006455 [Claviceps maximensis]